MNDIDSLFVAIFNLSGVRQQSAIVERGKSMVGHLFYVLKNRTMMGADNVTYREHVEGLRTVLDELLQIHGAVELCLRHQSLYINGCLLPQLTLGHDEPESYLVTTMEARRIESLRFEKAPASDVLDIVLDTLDALPDGWPEEGVITGSGIEITRARPTGDGVAPRDPEERARWVYLNLVDARASLERDDQTVRDSLRFARWHLLEMVESCERHPRQTLALTHLRWQPRFRDRVEVRDVNTSILACLMAQRLDLPRAQVLKLTHGAFLHRWQTEAIPGETSPAVRAASALLKGGGVNPFNFSVMVLLNERFEETRNRSAEIVRIAAMCEELLATSECTVATALTTMLSDSDLYYDRTTRLLLDVWAEHGGPTHATAP